MADLSPRLTAALSDRYRIERELGEGGMATVYLAHDLKHDRDVAIKVLKPELAAVLGADRFVQEIRTTAQLQHPNILPLFDSGRAVAPRLRDPGRASAGEAGAHAGGEVFLYYVMPYVEGESLRDKLDRETQLGVDEAVRITGEVADALDYAHRHGVVHRDIKPENILLHDGRPMVADFGIALAVSAAAGGRMTETGLSLGTPHYMSPEQATAEANITGRSDIYSLGAVLYEMLTGDPPHVGSSAQQIIMKIVTEEVTPVTKLRRNVPANVEAAVSKALEKLPADRFESAKAFADALQNPAFTTAAAAGSTGAASVADVRALAWWIRSPWSWATMALAVGALALAAVAESNAGNVPMPTFKERSYKVQAIFSARFAPDGRTIVFSAAGTIGTTPRLYVIRPDNPDPAPVGPDSTELLSVSSTGQLAVLTHALALGSPSFEGTLSTLALGGESPRELANRVTDADWAPGGQSMAVIRDTSGESELEYPLGTTLAQSAGYFSDVRVSPAGDAIAYFDHPTRSDNRGSVVIVDRKGHSIARSRAYTELEGMAWEPGGRAVLFSGSRAGSPNTMTIWELTRSGRERRVLGGAGGLTVRDVASNGRLLVTQDRFPALVFVRGPGAAHEANMGVRDFSVVPSLSDDGRYVAFADEGAMGGSDYTVILRRTDGSPETPLGPGSPLGFSTDGRFVLAQVPSTPPRLMLYPTGVGPSRQLDIGRFDALSPLPGANVVFDHDTHFFFCGTRPKALPRCYVGAVSGGPLRPVTPAGTVWGVISPDGSRVAAPVRHGAEIFPVAGGPPKVARGVLPGDAPIRWSPDGHDLWVWRQADSTFAMRVLRVNPGTGARSELTTIIPQNRNGLRSVGFLALANDPHVYAYTRFIYTSLLFTVDDVK